MTSSWLSESNAGLMSCDMLSPLLRPELLTADSFLCCLSSECDVSSGIFLANDPPLPQFQKEVVRNPPGTDVCPRYLGFY